MVTILGVRTKDQLGDLLECFFLWFLFDAALEVVEMGAERAFHAGGLNERPPGVAFALDGQVNHAG